MGLGSEAQRRAGGTRSMWARCFAFFCMEQLNHKLPLFLLGKPGVPYDALTTRISSEEEAKQAVSFSIHHLIDIVLNWIGYMGTLHPFVPTT